MTEPQSEKQKTSGKAEKPQKAEKSVPSPEIVRKQGRETAAKSAEAQGAPAESAAGAPAAPRRKKKGRKHIPAGIAHISVTFNNTIVTLTDPNGNAVSSASGGTAGFSGTKKGTPYAATRAAELAASRAMDHGMRRVVVMIKGPGPGREAAIQGLQAAGLQVMYIKDITPIPHNGCRAPKRRRV